MVLRFGHYAGQGKSSTHFHRRENTRWNCQRLTNYSHIMNKHLENIISDLLRFQIKQAERHGLDSITITLPRAKQIARELRESIKEQAKPVSRLDRIFSSAEKAKFAEY